MPGEDIYSWSPSATLNGSADTSINWSEGQPRASVNNSARSLLAAHAKQRDQQNGTIVTGGTANAQTFFSGNNYTTVPTGMRVLLKIGPSLTNTDTATLNMDNIGAVTVKNIFGSNLGAGQFRADSYAELLYDGTNWILLSAATQVTNITINTTEITTITGPVSVVDFTAGFDGTFAQYVVLVTGLTPSTDNAELWLQVTTDAGATWETAGNDYRWTRDVIYDEAPTWIGATYNQSGVSGSPVGDYAVRLTGPWLSSNAAQPASGEVRIFAPDLVGVNQMQWQFSFKDQGTFQDLYRGTGGYRIAAASNGIRFLMSVGMIVAGRFQMYGVKK